MESKLYRFLRPIIKFLVKVFICPKYIGLDNIPKEGRIILAGNHTSILDCLILIAATKRSVHFLAKSELWKGPKKILFSHMGLIPVNRKIKDRKSLELAEECLNSELLIGIFPEGTIKKGKDLLPFKIGAVKMAKDTDTKIIPFAIKGKYRLFSKNLYVSFGKEFVVKDDLDEENKKLRDTIIKMLEGE